MRSNCNFAAFIAGFKFRKKMREYCNMGTDNRVWTDLLSWTEIERLTEEKLNKMFDISGKMLASALYLQPGFSPEEKSDESEITDLDLSLYQFFPCFSTIGSNHCTPESDSDAIRSHKRLKLAKSIDHDWTDGRISTTLPTNQVRDYIWAYTERYLAMETMEEAAAAMIEAGKTIESREEGNGGDGMRLVQQLIACAEAVACRDKTRASALLAELRANALVFGSSFQRVASCFVQGLSDRLTQVQPLGAVGIVGPAAETASFTAEKDEALRLAYEICPQIQFGHFVANASILEAFEGETNVHVVDLGMTLGLSHGQQWLKLIHSLVNRTGQPPCRLRITGVGNSTKRLQAIGDELESYTRSVGLEFDFSLIQSSLENLKAEKFTREENEVVIINSILQLHCVVKESRGALNSVLQTLHELSPKLLILVEQDSSHNGPFFLGRFMESLHYYSAIFDSLDAMLPKYDTKRAKIEQFFFAEEIKNIISCEGPARVERHERVDQWRRRMSRAGFQPAPIKMISQAKQWINKIKTCDGYMVTEGKGCLVLGWKSKPIIAASCWKCN